MTFNEMMIRRARALTRSLGMRCAAGYLRRRGVSLEDALLILVGRAARTA